MVHIIEQNGPWTPKHPFHEVMEQTEVAEVLQRLFAMRQEFGDRVMLIEAEAMKAVAIVDLEEAVGIQIHGIFESAKNYPEDWYMKPGKVVMVPMTTVTDEELAQRLAMQSDEIPFVMVNPADHVKREVISLPHPEHVFPQNAREIQVPDHKTAKPLFRWVENSRPHEVVNDTYFAEGVTTL